MDSYIYQTITDVQHCGNYYSGDQIKKNKTGRACWTYGGEEKCIQDVGDGTEEKRPFEISRPKWEDNIKIYLQ